ncbi:MAG: bifunctional UDP-N-acetylglucosamine diphosphorylase/glucosamine-1-phosphate N-acetyltransferase GlmU [Variibacter sp.]
MEERVLSRTCLTIVLAAGEGTRMRSRLPKVLHRVGGRTLIGHVLARINEAGATATAVVIGPDHDALAAEVKRLAPSAEIFVQDERRGTAHAVLSARTALARGADDVAIVFGDTPFVRPQTLQRLRDALAAGAAVAVLGFRPADPTGYGRLIMDGDRLAAIREEKDASAAERAITFCNAGVMALAGKTALSLLERIDDANAKREFYLTDAVALAKAAGLAATAIEAEEDEVRGINTKAQLAEAEAELQKRLRAAALDAGVTLIAPDTVFLSEDTTFGRDVTVEPYVVFGPGVSVADNATIRSFSHLEGAKVGEGATVGPYARLRPGADLGAKTKVGNFVEVKAAQVEAGAKINHLSYVGDARVGANANVGAGTITCNYDGFAKHRTDIGANAFIGSNSALVAPVKIGDGAFVGSGSVVTDDVPADALALGRGRQSVKEGWAQTFRAANADAKKKHAET